MTQSDFVRLMEKVHEVQRGVNELGDLIRQMKSVGGVEHENPILFPVDPANEKTPRARTRFNDGTMTAPMIGNRLSKEFGTKITREAIIRMGVHVNAKPVYNRSQHDSRYSPEEVERIMTIFREFYKK